MNGFNSKVVSKNSSVTIWKILFNITIPIIHHKWGRGVSHNKGGLSQEPIVMISPPGLIITGKPLWYAPRGVNENFTPAHFESASGVPCLPSFSKAHYQDES